MGSDVVEAEIWENPGKGRVHVRKFDVSGREKSDVIAGGRKFHITTRERRMNQELAASEELDIFSNGTLRPVQMIEGTEDVEKLTSNPNHLSESEMVKLVQAHYRKFDERLATITHVGTLERLLELAQREDVGATVRTVGKLQERLNALNPARVSEVVPVAAGDARSRAGEIKPVTPK